jgi:glycosyltransferase involved in cell wall biosynthesis
MEQLSGHVHSLKSLGFGTRGSERGLTSEPFVSIVIPALNEEKNIGDVLRGIRRVMGSYPVSWEMIVVDDGSSDRTIDIANQNGAIVVRNGVNQGKGHALQLGFKHAHGNILVTIDADGSHNPADIGKLVSPILNGVDMTLGSRFVGGNGRDSTKRLHIVGNALINFTFLLVTGKKVSDSQTGFRAFRSKIVEEIKIESEGYQFETELTVKALKKGNIVKEIPVNVKARREGHSHVNPLSDGFKHFKILIQSIAD